MNKRERFWMYLLILILIGMFALVCMTWGHGEGECLTDVNGNARLSNGGWVKVTDHLQGAALKEYVHGHRSQYYDKNGNTTIRTTSFFSIDFDDNDSDFYADCPTAPPPRSPQSSTTPRGSNAPTLSETLDTVKDQVPVIPGNIETEVLDVKPPEVTDEREWYDYDFHSGWNFVTFPVLPNGVETLEGLYPHLYPKLYTGTVLVVYVAGCWLNYAGEGETGMIPLTVNMGVAVYAEQAFRVTMFGHRATASELDLMPGGNFVGAPSDYEVPSDFLGEAIAVLREIDGELYLIGRAGDSGDEPFAENEAVMVISEGIPAAPMAQRKRILTMTWGGIKSQ